MKKFPVSFLCLLFLFPCLCPFGYSQEEAADESSEKVRSILANPKFRNMLRSVKEDPEAVAASIKEDPDDLVKSATALFQEQLQGKEQPTGEVPATRSNKSTADQALDKLTGMLPDAVSKASSLTENPAIRSAVETVSNQVNPPAPATPAPPTATNQVAADLPAAPAPPEPETAVAENDLAIPASAAPPVAQIGNESPVIPDSPSLSGDEIPAPKPLEAKKTDSPGNAAAASKSPQNMEILARESVMDNKTGKLVFTGDVKVNHPEFIIKSDRLEILMTAGQATGQSSGKSPFKSAVASGGMVEITRISPDGKTQIAMARRADYNAETQDIILSGGPPYMQDGKSFVKPDSEDAQIILRGNGKYEVKGSGRSTIVIPVKGGKSMGNSPGLGGSLGNFGQ